MKPDVVPTSPIVFRSPFTQQLGDFLLLLLLAPLLYLIALVVTHPLHSATALYATTALLAVACLLFWFRDGQFRSLRIESDRVVLGTGPFARTIALAEIDEVQSGTFFERWTNTSSSPRVSLYAGKRCYRIRLKPRDAAACLKALLAACPEATGMDFSRLKSGTDSMFDDPASCEIAARISGKKSARVHARTTRRRRIAGLILVLIAVAMLVHIVTTPVDVAEPAVWFVLFATFAGGIRLLISGSPEAPSGTDDAARTAGEKSR